jgi:hypothetical protein
LERQADDAHSEDYEWFTNQLLMRGEEKGLKLMRALAQQEITFRRGHTLISQPTTTDHVKSRTSLLPHRS